MIACIGRSLLLAVGLAGCSVTVPVAVMTQHGDVLVGTVTATTMAGTFNVTNGALRCAGSYDPWEMNPALPISTLCSDGRQGFGAVVRDASMMAGQGTIRMSDGETADIVFGPAAGVMQPKIAPR